MRTNRYVVAAASAIALVLTTGCWNFYPDCDQFNRMAPGAVVVAPVVGKGIVYVYKDKLFWGCKDGENRYAVHGAEIIGAITQGCYFAYLAEPGEHTFWRSPNHTGAFLTFAVEAGKSYYVDATGGPGPMVLISAPIAMSVIKTLDYCEFPKPDYPHLITSGPGRQPDIHPVWKPTKWPSSVTP